MAALHQGESDPFDLVRAEEMIRLYDSYWSEPFEVLAVEREFDCDLVNPLTGRPSRTVRLAGKLDVVVRTRDGRVLVVEHKTSSQDISSGSDYWKTLQLDNQISAYFVGAKSLGFDVEGCLYDVLGKPAQRPYKATPEADRKYTKAGALYANQHAEDETPEEYRLRVRAALEAEPSRYLVRGEVSRLESEESEALWDFWTTAHQIREGDRANHWPRNPDACVRYGRTCEFFGICTGTASLDDETMFIKTDNPHPELNQHAA